MKVSVKQFIYEVTGGKSAANFEAGLKLLKKWEVPVDADASPRKDCVDFAHFPEAQRRYIELQKVERASRQERKKDNFDERRGVGGNNIAGLSMRLREMQVQLDRMEGMLSSLANAWGTASAPPAEQIEVRS